jgi:hypothetical protein
VLCWDSHGQRHTQPPCTRHHHLQLQGKGCMTTTLLFNEGYSRAQQHGDERSSRAACWEHHGSAGECQARLAHNKSPTGR